MERTLSINQNQVTVKMTTDTVSFASLVIIRVVQSFWLSAAKESDETLVRGLGEWAIVDLCNCSREIFIFPKMRISFLSPFFDYKLFLLIYICKKLLA